MYEIMNRTNQVLNLLVREEQTGRSKTLCLMPKGSSDSSKRIQENQMTTHIQSLEEKKMISIRKIEG